MIYYTRTVDAQTSVMPVGQMGNFQLIFSDEFNGTSLDLSKWNTCYYWTHIEGCVINDKEWQWYSPDNILLGGGLLKLRAQKLSSPYTSPYGKTYNYRSGMISSGRATTASSTSKFSFTYGYMEIKAKAPKGKGLWPAFWTLRPDHSWPPEIDVLEILGHEPNKLYMYFHYQTSSGITSFGNTYLGPDFSTGFHTYAVDWSPNAITWYVDGLERSKFTNVQHIPNTAMYLIANLAVGGPESWPGAPDSTTTFPAYYEIDHIRVWKKISDTNSPTPTKPPNSPTPTSPLNSPTSGSKLGDANGDGKVDIKDYVFWLKNYSKNVSGAANGDFNSNGKVDGLDYIIWMKNYSTGPSLTPTPSR